MKAKMRSEIVAGERVDVKYRLQNKCQIFVETEHLSAAL